MIQKDKYYYNSLIYMALTSSKPSIIAIGGDVIEIYPLEKDIGFGPYTSILRNNSTNNLDQIFGLVGEPILEEDIRSEFLDLSVKSNRLGLRDVESTMGYFVDFAKSYGYFCGFWDKEIKRKVHNSPTNLAKRVFIDHALTFSDEGNGPYLKRIIIEDKPAIFPQNLLKFAISYKFKN